MQSRKKLCEKIDSRRPEPEIAQRYATIISFELLNSQTIVVTMDFFDDIFVPKEQFQEVAELYVVLVGGTD